VDTLDFLDRTFEGARILGGVTGIAVAALAIVWVWAGLLERRRRAVDREISDLLNEPTVWPSDPDRQQRRLRNAGRVDPDDPVETVRVVTRPYDWQTDPD
jgi:hypothetical protein